MFDRINPLHGPELLPHLYNMSHGAAKNLRVKMTTSW